MSRIIEIPIVLGSADESVQLVRYVRDVARLELVEVQIRGVPTTGGVPDYMLYTISLSNIETNGCGSKANESATTAVPGGKIAVALTGSVTHHIYIGRTVWSSETGITLNDFKVSVTNPYGASATYSGVYLLLRAYCYD